MPVRASSPAVSENEFDISSALVRGEEASSSEDDDDGVEGQKSAKRVDQAQPAVDAAAALDLDDDEDDEHFIAVRQAASNRKASNLKSGSVKKGGGFQAMGLNANLLKSISRKGFSVPTPIQRKAIPLVLDGQDVVGMARTGSGKTAAFVVPMIEKLKAHSAKIGARALVLSPSRELALQTLKVVKELGKGTDLKAVLLVGGDSLEEQFGLMTANPDIVIATPGRFLHLKAEMSLDLSSVRYVVFDEADRLFELGFASHLAEILHALPAARQTLLFSATLPKSLVEFARAGLQEPKLIRLDSESKVSQDLQSAFFTVRTSEKEGALLHILNDIIKVPTGSTDTPEEASDEPQRSGKKRKREHPKVNNKDSPTEYSTIIFAATKHHVEYLTSLLRTIGFAVSYSYGSVDQIARNQQISNFRAGKAHLLVVTDVAARGIDIPLLANVINYDFPAQPKLYVHRVGRTARAGKQGWSYSILCEKDVPYLLDLQLFLARRLVSGMEGVEKVDFARDVALGSMPRDQVAKYSEWATKLLEESGDLAALRTTSQKGEKLYTRTRSAASSESVKRAKEILAGKAWTSLNALFGEEKSNQEAEREDMLAKVSGFRPQETVFELGKRGGGGETGEIMRKQRARIDSRKQKKSEAEEPASQQQTDTADTHIKEASDDEIPATLDDVDMGDASENELEVTFSQNNSHKSKDGWKDTENFISYVPTSTNLAEERGYGVHSGATSGSNFFEAARGVTMDMNNDEGHRAFGLPSQARGVRWDKKSKKYVSRTNDEDGSKGSKLVRGESGGKIPASFKSGRFDAWRKSNRLEHVPRTGEPETRGPPSSASKRFKNHQVKAPKDADKYRDDYHKQKKRLAEAKENRVGRFSEGKGRREIKNVDDVRKQRNMERKRREKNARPSRKR